MTGCSIIRSHNALRMAGLCHRTCCLATEFKCCCPYKTIYTMYITSIMGYHKKVLHNIYISMIMSVCLTTLVNVYVDLVVFTPIAGTS